MFKQGEFRFFNAVCVQAVVLAAVELCCIMLRDVYNQEISLKIKRINQTKQACKVDGA